MREENAGTGPIDEMAATPTSDGLGQVGYDDEGFGDDLPPEPSLVDDVMAFAGDARTYAQAELAFQKSRAGFVANRAKYVVAYGAAAFGLLHLALIAIAVGAVISLAPLIGPAAATLVVGLILIVAGLVCVHVLRGKIADIRAAFAEEVS